MKHKGKIIFVKTKVSLDVIHESIAQFFNVDKDDIFKLTNKRHITNMRHWFHYFAITLNYGSELSSSLIGAYYFKKTGKKYDHATVLNSKKTIENLLCIYPYQRVTKDHIKVIINSKLSEPRTKEIGMCAEKQFKINRYYENNPANLN